MPFEDLLKPECWAHVAQLLRPGYRIEVLAEDGSYFAELLVVSAGRLWAKVAVLRKIDLTEAVGEAPAQGADTVMSIMWSGPHSKFRVIRQNASGGKDVMRDGFETREEASVWMAEHIKALAA